MLQPDITDLLDALVRAGKHTVLETNGATDLSKVPDDRLVMISMDIKCPSSGMTDRMLEKAASEIKKVQDRKADENEAESAEDRRVIAGKKS